MKAGGRKQNLALGAAADVEILAAVVLDTTADEQSVAR